MSKLPLLPLSGAVITLGSLLAAQLAGCDAGSTSVNPGDGSVAPTGCVIAGGAAPQVAPDGYYVNGNTICTEDGKPHLFHGVDRPSLEWDPNGVKLSAEDFSAMAGFHANVVRVALNQDFWLSDSPSYAPGYAARVDQVVQWAEAAGLDVILDLHWSDRGSYASKPGQQPMADMHSVAFWKEVAAVYRGDGRVMFELYNEPHDVPAEVWLSGGNAGFPVAGMQALHDAVRGAGAENVVLVGGLNWAYDLSIVQSFPVKGHNIVYVTHPYNNSSDRQPDRWTSSFGDLARTAPVMATEFGDGTGTCSPGWDQYLIADADRHNMNWTAWAWWVGDCKFPSLLTDWSYGTTSEGAVVKAALSGYQDPTPPRKNMNDGGLGEGG